ncbi:hypothetical protein HNQ65_003961 [Prosthecobacter vanneervenii]|uniref:Uncharacterized protein n=1 Tax=Prosthecobacter vanneervenii TaxID=48466 RepID=A0A7W8DLP5_9BACT|nr:hypothetical protein [Prosthecobacter vanneervenii]
MGTALQFGVMSRRNPVFTAAKWKKESEEKSGRGFTLSPG